jgi:SAM-dependent methyltransferase
VTGRLTPRRIVRGSLRRIPLRPFRLLLPTRLMRPVFRVWLGSVAASPDARRAVHDLLVAYDDVYAALDRAAIAYGDGVHPKHRLTRYHDFFVERVQPGERVLDVGCGIGSLAHDLVTRAHVFVVGIDNNPTHLAFARERFAHERLTFLEGDVLAGFPEDRFDVVVLSNVLEHIGPRVELLRGLVASARPKCVLLRVPVLARDWTVPLRGEVGLRQYWEPDHEIEYDPEGFRAELAEAGLDVTELVHAWGELWAKAEPRREP